MRSLHTGWVRGWVVLAGLAFVGAAGAEEVSLEARDAQGLSAFALDFGDGVPRVAAITYSELDLRIDPGAGSARFAYYHQTAEPLVLPSPLPPFEVSTGELVIEIVPGSSTGSFDAESGEFTTSEDYVIHFDGDLSVLGLTSPVVLSGAASTGTLTNPGGDYASGQASLAWSGTYELEFTDGTVIPLAYTCGVDAEYSQFTGCPADGCGADLNRDCRVDSADLGRLLANFGATGELVMQRSGDVNGDGAIDIVDLGAMLASLFVDCN